MTAVAVAAAGTSGSGWSSRSSRSRSCAPCCCTPATPTSTPNVSPQVLLAISEPRPPQSSAFVFFVPWKRVGQMLAAVVVERPRAAHVDRAGRAAFEHAGRRALAHGQLGEQLGREQVEVDFAVGVLRVGAAGRGDRDRRVVQQHAGEVRAEAADRDVAGLRRVISRVMVMPGMRLKDSAMLVSGNLPMSSAKIESVKPVDSFLASVELCRLARKPVTTTSSSGRAGERRRILRARRAGKRGEQTGRAQQRGSDSIHRERTSTHCSPLIRPNHSCCGAEACARRLSRTAANANDGSAHISDLQTWHADHDETSETVPRDNAGSRCCRPRGMIPVSRRRCCRPHPTTVFRIEGA